MGLLTAAMAEEQMKVNADNVNVRCGNGANFEVVCQVHQGDLVTVRRTVEDWAEIEPPSQAELWVYADLIQESTVIASRVQIRSGPGISYRPAGTLEKGRKVTIEATSGDWARITPPPEASVWISRQFLESCTPPVVEVDREAPQAHVAPAQPAPEKEKVVILSPKSPSPAPAQEARMVSEADATVPLPPRQAADVVDENLEDPALLPVALRGRRLVQDREQGERVRLEGEIRKAPASWGRLSAYRLAGRDAKGRIVTRCYLLGNPKQLESILGRRASIDGRLYWVHRVRYPGVRPERIRLYPEQE